MNQGQLLYVLLPVVATAVMVAIGWLIKRAIGGLEDTDKRIETKVDKIESFTKNAANSIVEIQTLMSGKGFVINQRLAYTSGSPIRLTEYGETIMKESSFNDILTKNREFLVNLVKSKNPQTNYDIQDFSMLVIKDLVNANNPLVVSLKNYSYNNGLPLEIIINSAGIVLRDEVMKEVKFEDATLDKK